jgi:hypothetical protein
MSMVQPVASQTDQIRQDRRMIGAVCHRMHLMYVAGGVNVDGAAGGSSNHPPI